MSSAWPATIRFNLAFSRSSLLQALDVLGLQRAELPAPAVIGVLRDLQRLGDLGDRAALPEHPIGLVQLADHLLRRVPASLHVSSFLAHDQGRLELSQAPDRTQGVTPNPWSFPPTDSMYDWAAFRRSSGLPISLAQVSGV